MTEVNNAAVQAALKSAGVEFIEENGGGAGVRLRKTKAPRCAYSDAREGVRNSLSAPAGTVAVFYFSYARDGLMPRRSRVRTLKQGIEVFSCVKAR
jgi:hypothetical protein